MRNNLLMNSLILCRNSPVFGGSHGLPLDFRSIQRQGAVMDSFEFMARENEVSEVTGAENSRNRLDELSN